MLCDDLDGWDGKWGCGREAQEEGIFVYRSLILFVDQQKLTQHCKTTTPQKTTTTKEVPSILVAKMSYYHGSNEHMFYPNLLRAKIIKLLFSLLKEKMT